MGIFDKLKRTKTDAEKQLKQAANDSDSKKVPKAKSETPAKEEKATKKKTDEKKVAQAKAIPLGDTHAILLEPLLTEKSFLLQQANKYSFSVSPKANKYQVKVAIKEVYGISPISVHMMRKRSQNKKRWGKVVGKTTGKKKAIVTMPEGTILNLTD